MPRASRKAPATRKTSPGKAKAAKKATSSKPAKKSVKKSAKKVTKKTADKSSRATGKKASTSSGKSSAKGLSKRALVTVEKQLLKRRRELLERMNAVTMSPLGGDSAEPGDAGDWATASFQMDVTAGILESETRELQALDDALRRVGEGSYGICQECDCQIPAARLKAVPQATTCLKCKMALERGHVGRVSPQRWRTGASVVRMLDTDADDADDKQ